MNESLATSMEIGPLFLRAFGIDLSDVVGFTLRCESGEPATLEIRKVVVRSDRMGAVRRAVDVVAHAYRLEPSGDSVPVNLDVSASIGLAGAPVETIHRPAD